MKYTLSKLFIFLCLALTCGCAELNGSSPYDGYDSRYDNGYYGNDDYYRRRERDRYYDQQRDLERDRYRLERERRELDAQRERERRERESRSRLPEVRQPERCPSGFSPSERKCSQEERRKGCQDMRLPGGLGCVKR